LIPNVKEDASEVVVVVDDGSDTGEEGAANVEE